MPEATICVAPPLAGGVVAVAGGVGDTVDGAVLGDGPPVRLVGVVDQVGDQVQGIGLGDESEAPGAVRALVVAVAVLRAVGEGDGGDAVQRVVRVARGLALGVGLGEQIAGRVVGI